jgi:glycine/D-amino acid oxidase-like deaminating enzyme
MTDVLVIGGAATGWATAFHLKHLDSSLSVSVFEMDTTLARSSTMLCESNVRIQFNLDENILMSKYGMEVIEELGRMLEVGGEPAHIERRGLGNLFLVDEDGRPDALAGMENQLRHGGNVEWLDMDEVAARFPAAASDNLVGGTYGPEDGPVDASAVVAGYRRRALADGVVLSATRVETLAVEDGRVEGVVAGGRLHEADVVLLAAGAWTPSLMETVGISIPVQPAMRTVYVVEGTFGDRGPLPAVFLPSGAYIYPEVGSAALMAWSTADDPIGFDFTPAPRSRFYDVIWPEIARNLPAFDSLEVVRSWAGLYAQNTLDANAILGEWPTLQGLYLATGFSGHGYQHCHAMGRHLAELVTGAEPSLDLSRFGPQRVLDGVPYAESAGRII